MKNLFVKHISIRLSIIVFILLILIICFLGSYFIKGTSGTKSNTILGGLIAGLIVFIIQFILSWNEHRAMEEIKSLEIINVLPHREDRQFYQSYIDKARKRIDMMGVTAIRFMEHFADYQSKRRETRILLDALDRDVKVRILLPKKEYLFTRTYLEISV